MRFTVDGKSLLLGLFAGAALVAGLGAAQGGPQVGRYEVAVSNGEVVVIDTATREVWDVQRPLKKIPSKPFE